MDGTCVMLNEASAVLERDVCAALRRWLRAAPADALPLRAPPPAHPAHAAPAPPPAPARDLDAQRLLYLVSHSTASRER